MIHRENRKYFAGLVSVFLAVAILILSLMYPSQKGIPATILAVVIILGMVPGLLEWDVSIEPEENGFFFRRGAKSRYFTIPEIKKIFRNKLVFGYTLELQTGEQLYLPFHLTSLTSFLASVNEYHPHLNHDEDFQNTNRLLREAEESYDPAELTWRELFAAWITIPMEGALLLWMLESLNGEGGLKFVVVMYVILLIGTGSALLMAESIIGATDRFIRHFESLQKWRRRVFYRRIIFGVPRIFYLILAAILYFPWG